MDIPAQYVLSCIIYPANTNYQVFLVNNVLPKLPEQKFVVHKFGETYRNYPEPEDLLDICDSQIYDNLSLKLLKFENGYLNQVKDKHIESRDNAII
jgi:hypothetical protein